MVVVVVVVVVVDVEVVGSELLDGALEREPVVSVGLTRTVDGGPGPATEALQALEAAASPTSTEPTANRRRLLPAHRARA